MKDDNLSSTEMSAQSKYGKTEACIGEDMEKKEPSSTIGENGSWHGRHGKQYRAAPKS